MCFLEHRYAQQSLHHLSLSLVYTPAAPDEYSAQTANWLLCSMHVLTSQHGHSPYRNAQLGHSIAEHQQIGTEHLFVKSDLLNLQSVLLCVAHAQCECLQAVTDAGLLLQAVQAGQDRAARFAVEGLIPAGVYPAELQKVQHLLLEPCFSSSTSGGLTVMHGVSHHGIRWTAML